MRTKRFKVVACLGSTDSVRGGFDIEIGYRRWLRPQAAMRPLAESRESPAAHAGRTSEPVPRQAGQDAGAEQRRGGAEQVENLRQTLPDPRPPCADPHHPGEVAAGQSRDPPREWTLRDPEAVVRACGEIPGGGGRLGQGMLECPASTRPGARRFAPQPVVQY